MINYIWFALFAIGILVGTFTTDMEKMTLIDFDDLSMVDKLAQRLGESDDGVTQYVKGKFSPKLTAMLNAPKDSAFNKKALRKMLVSELEEIIHTDTALYQPQRFAQVELSHETLILVDEAVTGEKLAEFNQRLLSEVYSYQLKKSRIEKVTGGIFDAASTAVILSIGLIGIMALWLGLMKVAEEAGAVRFVSRLLYPVLRWLFPGIPKGHPALGSIVANMAANMLGLNNAATPLGLKAMQDLQELNEEKDTATNEMCTFLAINTSSVTIIPATVIGLRVAAGSTAPAEIIGTALVATGVSTTVAIIASKVLEKINSGRKK